MELNEPRSKTSKFRLEPKSSLPLVFGNKGELTMFHANLTALGSCIDDPVEIQMIYNMGYFGKGSFSKSHPSFDRIQHGAPPVTRKRQWQRRQEWITDVQKLSATTFCENDKHNLDCQTSFSQPSVKVKKENHNKGANEIEILDYGSKVPTNGQNNKTNTAVDQIVQLDSTEEEDASETSVVDNHESSYVHKDCFPSDNYDLVNISNKYNRGDSDLQGKVLVLSDSDSETDNYLINIKPQIKHENFPVRETLHLTAEETFFLMYGLGCLRVVDFDGKYLSIGQIWNYFCKEQKCFLQKYIAYHYFRSKGWIVKSGLNYGGDYLLYKEGPSFYHSSYIVIIDVLDAVALKRIESKSLRNPTWNSFIGLQRLAETVRKVNKCDNILSIILTTTMNNVRRKYCLHKYCGHLLYRLILCQHLQKFSLNLQLKKYFGEDGN
ncbi:tRNA-splicing endonuclease subunit Sen2 isoform X2 [Phymastichus coffea]|uniref:tRNA-splicing endonuclease subunit Sen2 isoform X2 n=1 Tax=Phymastichus coffea TaxID=108790 RepID=UPI00273CAF34|nr:tRNA-splicing endonuclease subunit Sen2 isoform X2 [Phymastichus coffea]